MNPGITQMVERVSKEVNNNKTKAIEKAGITIQPHPNDPDKSIYVTKSGQRLETLDQAVAEAVKFVLSNDDNAGAYFNQLNELGLGDSVTDEINRLSKGADDVFGLDKAGTSTQNAERFNPAYLNSLRSSRRAPAYEADTRVAPIAGITSKDGVELTKGQIKAGLEGDFSEMDAEQKREFDQRNYMLNAFGTVEANQIASLGLTRNDDFANVVSEYENHIRTTAEQKPLMRDIARSFSLDDGRYSLEVEKESGRFSPSADVMMVVDSNGNKVDVPKRFTADMVSASKDHVKRLASAREEFLEKGLVIQESAISTTDTPTMKNVLADITQPEFVDLTNIQVIYPNAFNI